MDGVHDRNGGSCDSAEHWCTAWRRAACRQAMMGAAPGGWTGCARRSKTQRGSLQRLAPGGEIRSARRTRDNELLLEAIAPGGGT
ncbi:hypothetical protein DEO72_LG7g2320 [Vigna unguiculata]|uniref:Uncharacterized protein n=1 Tax=Vigna unguiculata TaxID=3917 RepID=A0A4D6MLM4_VIGUN|nr:hypothetical protein DEO72_LG7g2320 [Vigna unguiculata]